MSAADSAVSEDGSRRRIGSGWATAVVVLVGLWLWLVFSSGGYIAHQWLLPSVTLGLLGLVVFLLVAYPRRPRQLSLALLVLFGCYGLWVALSALWAESTTRVWMESGRTFSYLLILALALVYFTDPGARRAFRYLLMAATLAILATCVCKLAFTDSIAGLFIAKRFSYPISYPNNAGALFLIAFWPLMWLSSGPEERAPVRGAALGLATGLLGLAIMTQSRGAAWSLAISLVFMFVVSPARLRMLFYLLVPALLTVYTFPSLNRYWSEGPEAVGGALGARTLVVAAVTAAFIGMILALLERWVKVSRRMKAIFGAIVLLAVLAGAVYGSIALTRDVGGPFKWVSQSWQQFSGQTETPSEATSTTRYTLLSSSGRVEIWKAARQEFESAPVLGVGADNFVFEFYRIRARELRLTQQAHSFELQVLGETGVVGGIFAFGGILLALGGILWPRCTAGWRGARETWLRRRKDAGAAETGGASTRWCKPRWGNTPVTYGWEMALLGGAAYWLIHASVDWLWQMAGVTIPALLFIALGVASVDARAGLLWPRLSSWLRISSPEVATESLNEEEAAAAAEFAPTDSAPEVDASLTPERRSDQYRTRIRRRANRAARKRRSGQLLQPPGFLSHGFRGLMVALSLVVIIATGLPYMSLKYQESAVALAKTDGVAAVARAGSAHWWQPADPGPYSTQASIYKSAARAALESTSSDKAGAVLDNLALAVASYEEAIALEPADWSLRYQAGVTALNLLLATGYATGLSPEFDYSALSSAVPGLEDWSALAGLEGPLPDTGAAAGSLAATTETRETADSYRELSQTDLAQLALDFLGAAKERNPLASAVGEAIETVRAVAGMD